MKIERKYVLTGAVFGLLTVALGAFGAHGLKGLLIANAKLEVWETAVQYLSIHAIALLVLAALHAGLSARYVHWTAWGWILGTVVFSGSLFLLAVTNIGILGAITPIGGVLLILGWVSLILAAIKKAV